MAGNKKAAADLDHFQKEIFRNGKMQMRIEEKEKEKSAIYLCLSDLSIEKELKEGLFIAFVFLLCLSHFPFNRRLQILHPVQKRGIRDCLVDMK